MTRPIVPSAGAAPAVADSLQAVHAPATPVSIEELASLSHEFRTPLNGVLGLARLLESTPLTGEQRSYVDALRESGEHLLGLVNQLLDFARLGASTVEIQTGDVSLENLLRGVCELTAPRATEKGLEIGWWIAPGLGRIRGDEGRLRQILLNYVANAIKFTGKVGGRSGPWPHPAERRRHRTRRGRSRAGAHLRALRPDRSQGRRRQPWRGGSWPGHRPVPGDRHGGPGRR
jgi:nitrogen-specific signal transduction histidine kinase